MNLLDRNVVSGLMLSALLLFFSCEDPGEIGLTVNPDRDEIDVKLKRFTLPFKNVFNDSVRTDISGRLIVGAIDDPIFGRTVASSFTQFNLDFDGDPASSTSAEMDSVVLHLAYSYWHGFDFSQRQTFNVYQLADTLFNTVTYLNNMSTDIDSRLLGTATVEVVPEQDTVLSIRISDRFANILFEEAREFIAESIFRDELKGLAIIPDENNTVIVGFDPFDESTRMSIYYSIPEFEIDSLEYRFEFSGDNTIRYNRYLNDRSNSVMADAQNKTVFDSPDGLVHWQPATGIMPVIDFSPFKEFTDSLDHLVISRAEIEIGPSLLHGIYPSINPPAETRYIFAKDGNIDGPGTVFDPANNAILDNNSYLSGTFNVDSHGYDEIVTQSYRGTLTIYLELLATGQIEFGEVAMLPRTISTFDQASFSKEGVELKVYYTTTSNL
ncbi:MAG: DUF4270 family protein [Cyclobacteriaceae bacterium]